MLPNRPKKIVTYPLAEQRIEKRRLEEEFKTRLPYTIEQEDIPEDPQEFFEDFGGIQHPRQSLKLAPYQYKVWKSKAKTKFVVKSQKTGMTTTGLIEDFQIAITKGRGMDILIIGQKHEHSVEHLYTLKHLIVESEKYRKYLITKSSELFFKEEQTKVATLYIKNPDNPFRPTRIIAVAFAEPAIWSWKNVYRIHMSDPAAAEVVDDAGIFAAAFSRLANTNGQMFIEGPPRGTVRQFYDLWKMYKDNHEPNFEVFTIKAGEAVEFGLIDNDFLQREKKRLGHLYPQYYEGEFIAGTGNLFDYDSILACENRGKTYGLEVIIPSQLDYSTVKCIGFDVGHGSSYFNVTALEFLPATYFSQGTEQGGGILRVIFSKEYERSVYGDMIKEIDDLNKLIRPRKIYTGAVNPETIRDVKIAVGESPKYEALVARAQNQKRPVEQYMQVVPIPENTLGPEIHEHTRAWVESGLVAIHPLYDNLLQQMKMAVIKPNGQLDKNQMVSSDSLDGFKFACWYYMFDAATGARNQSFRFYQRGSRTDQTR